MVKKRVKKKGNGIFIIGIVALIALGIILIFAFKSGESYDSTDVEAFTKCLVEKGTVMYGTFWCPKCAEVKKKFGESFRYMNYVECDPRGDNEQSELCIEKGIEFYATFEFNGDPDSRLVGKPTFQELSEKTGCPAPVKK
ncbi:hypothetical protein J4423_01275 [Candidatus Pacearchaeota archaeon]|nr:hypothetical protein [Candidatus Pacearchaeota archaeon]